MEARLTTATRVWFRVHSPSFMLETGVCALPLAALKVEIAQAEYMSKKIALDDATKDASHHSCKDTISKPLPECLKPTRVETDSCPTIMP
eukprot:6478445-Amphidinium_carterae.1